MDKEFVTYEQALALKELGFDRTCLASYADKIFYLATHRNNLSNKTFIAAPLKQQVFRWFRDKHNINGEIFAQQRPSDKFMYGFKIAGRDVIYDGFKTYEEAENACIDKLIKIVKQK